MDFYIKVEVQQNFLKLRISVKLNPTIKWSGVGFVVVFVIFGKIACQYIIGLEQLM